MIDVLRKQLADLHHKVVDEIRKIVKSNGELSHDNLNPQGIHQIDLCQRGTIPIVIYCGNDWYGLVAVHLITVNADGDITMFVQQENVEGERDSFDIAPHDLSVDYLINILEKIQ